MRFQYLFTWLIFYFLITPLCALSGMGIKENEDKGSDTHLINDMALSLKNYIQKENKKNAQIRPESFKQAAEALHSIFGSIKFQRGRIAFGKDSIEVYNERVKKWEHLRDVGNPIFYSWFNNAVGTVCDSDQNIKKLISVAGKYFFSCNKNTAVHKEQIDLLKQLPISISDRIQQAYLFWQLPDWVQRAGLISLDLQVHASKTRTSNLNQTLTIQNDTKFIDVKRMLQDREGISVKAQILSAQWRGSFKQLYSLRCTEIPDNNRYVKEVMAKFNTKNFVLSLNWRHPV